MSRPGVHAVDGAAQRSEPGRREGASEGQEGRSPKRRVGGSLGPTAPDEGGGRFYLTVDEVAEEYLRTSRKAVYEMIRRKQLPGVVRFLKRRVLVRRVDLVRWLECRRDSVLE